jgi:hypothetical protein
MKKTLFLYALVLFNLCIIAQNDLCYNQLNSSQSFKPGNSGTAFDDLNNDGYIDIITSEVSPNRIAVRYGNLSAYYSYSVSSTTLLYSPSSIKVADVNGDLIKDIIFSEGVSGGNIGIIRGNVTGGFDAPYYLTAASGKLLEIRDFNQDTYPDLLMMNQSANLRVVPGKGNGTFDNSITILNTQNSYDRVFVSDFNQDSRPDIITTDLTSSTSGSIKVYSGNMSGAYYTVSGPLTYTVVHNTSSNSTPEFFISDFNNDGFKDFAVTSSNGINLFNNNGTGAFSVTTLSTYAKPGGISGADFNNDGNMDLVVSYPKNVTSLIGNMVRILTGNGNGTFNFLSDINISAPASEFIVKDFDKNGALDIICSMGSSIGILFGNNQAQFSSSFTLLLNENEVNSTLEDNLMDLNNDGYFDIVGYLQSGGFLISKGLTDSTVAGIKIHPLFGYGTSSSSAEIEDFNMDGNMDIAVFDEDSLITLSVFYSNSLGELSAPTVFKSPDIGIYYSKEIVSGNFNADNYPDVIVKKTMYLGSATGITSQTIGINITSGIIGKSDLNHDGKMDLIGLPFNSQSVQYMINSGNGIFSSGPLIFSGIQPAWAEAADLNNDTYADLIVANDGAQVKVIMGTSNISVYGTATNYTTGTNPNDVKTGDFNGDGNIDVAVSNRTSDNVSILLGNGTGALAFSNNIYIGPRPETINVLDFNQDGILDLAVKTGYVRSELLFFKGNGNGTFTYLKRTQSFGNRYVTGDLNHDNVPDLVNASDRFLSVLYSGAPSVKINGLNSACMGTPLQLTATGANSYTWSTNENTASVIVTPTTTSTYTVIGKDSQGCASSALKTITVSANAAPTLSILGNTLICAGSTTSLNVSGANTYTWNNGSTGSSVSISLSSTNTISVVGTDLNGCQNTATLAVTTLSVPNTVITGSNTLCSGNTISLSLSGITTNTISWNTGASTTSISINPITTTTYSALVTAANGCTKNNTKTVLVNPTPTISISGPSTMCSGTTSTLVASGASTYTWSGSNSNTYTVSPYTSSSTVVNYQVYGTSVSGCTTSAVFTATVNHAPNVMIFHNTLCAGAQATFAIGGASTYTWSNAATTSVINVTPTVNGSYSVSGQDVNGCYYTATKNYTVYPTPTLSISSPPNICAGNSTSLSVTGASTYTWSTNTFGPSVTVMPPATSVYTVTGRNTDGCYNTATVQVLVNQSPVIGVNNGSVCIGETFTIVPSGANTYSYSSGSDQVSPVATSVYTVSGIDVNNCLGTQTVNVVVNPLPVISVGGGTVCAGSSFTLVPMGASNYTYSGGSDIVNPVAVTDYTITGQDANGCFASTTVQVNVNAVPNITLSATSNSVCAGASTHLSVSGTDFYLWNTGAVTSSISITPTINTTYTVTGTDLNNCSSTQTVSVFVDNNCQDVWPGDANSDGLADNLDLLELGLHYTQTGAPRATTSNAWQPYFSNNWTGTITNGKNLNHSDCNGDGAINDDDTLAIYSNYGLTHAFKPAQINSFNPQLSIVPDQAYVAKGTWGTASIYLGDAITSINNMNGVAFTVDFDNTLIETNSIYIEYQNSFLDAGQNLHFRKLDFANGKIFTATTHTLNNNVSGNGKIATLHYQIKSGLTTDDVLNLGILQANQSDASGIITPLTSGTGTLMAIGASVGLQELNGNIVSVSPNPTNGSLTINSKTELQKVEVISITGQILLSEIPSNVSHTLHLHNFANGIYFVNLYQNDRVVKREKIVLNK